MDIKSIVLAVTTLVLSSSLNAAIINIEFSVDIDSYNSYTPSSTYFSGTPLSDSQAFIDNALASTFQVSVRIDTLADGVTLNSLGITTTYTDTPDQDAGYAELISHNMNGLFDECVDSLIGSCSNSARATTFSDGSSGTFIAVGSALAITRTSGLIDFLDIAIGDSFNLTAVNNSAGYTRLSDGETLSYVTQQDQYIGTAIVTSAYVETVPVPAAVWLFGSGLIGLIGFARRK